MVGHDRIDEFLVVRFVVRFVVRSLATQGFDLRDGFTSKQHSCASGIISAIIGIPGRVVAQAIVFARERGYTG